MKVQTKSPSSAFTPVPNGFQTPPFSVQAELNPASPKEFEKPDLSTQLEWAARFGHNLGRIRVEPNQLKPKGSGTPLPEVVRRKMERAFGQNFSDVRVHEDESADAIGAHAYTRGNHLCFAPGKYQPESQSVQKLIGHELTHIVQQRAGRVRVPQGKMAPINDEPTLEAEADALGTKAATGEPVPINGAQPGHIPSGVSAFQGTPAGSAVIQAKKRRRSSRQQNRARLKEWRLAEQAERRLAEQGYPAEQPRYKNRQRYGFTKKHLKYKSAEEESNYPNYAITALPKEISTEVLSNILKGKPAMKPRYGKHGRVAWATVTHEGGMELPSRPYSGRENPEYIPMRFTYQPSSEDKVIPEDEVDRIYQRYRKRALRRQYRKRTKRSPVKPRIDLRKSDFQDSDVDLQFQDPDVVSDSKLQIGRLRKQERRRLQGKARRENRRKEARAPLEKHAEKGVQYHTYRHLGTQVETLPGLVTARIPGGHPLSQKPGKFLLAGEAAKHRLVIEGQKKYQARPLPEHPIKDNSDMARFIQALHKKAPEVYEEKVREQENERIQSKFVKSRRKKR